MADAPIPRQLPQELYRYFWDIDARKLNPAEHSKYVINRILNIGDVPAVRWVRKYYPKNIIVDTIKTGRDISLKTANFWAHYYRIPREEIKCMQEPYLSMRKTSWHN